MDFKTKFFGMTFIFLVSCVEYTSAMLETRQRMVNQLNKLIDDACEKSKSGNKVCRTESDSLYTEQIKKGCTLHTACTFGHIDIVKHLIQNGANINRRAEFYYFTPLHCAVMSRQVCVVRYLLDSGADPDVQTRHGYSALDLAYRQKDTVLIELFPNQSSDDAS